MSERNPEVAKNKNLAKESGRITSFIIIAVMGLLPMIAAVTAYHRTKFTPEKALVVAQRLLNDSFLQQDDIRLLQTTASAPGAANIGWKIAITGEPDIECAQQLFRNVNPDTDCAVID